MYNKLPSYLAQRTLYLEGEPLSLDGRPYLPPVYDYGYKNVLLKCGRQVEKSSTLRHIALTRSVWLPNHRSLYVSPSQSQTSDFAKELNKIIDTSPFVKENYVDNSLVNQTLERQLSNGSSIKLRAAYLHADRCRGIAAKDLYIDEIQDMIHANIAVIEECQSHYQAVARRLFSGTPKTFNNPIQRIWADSSQCEWMVKCSSCNRYNNLGVENIKKEGLSCYKCGGFLDPTKGVWAKQKKDALFEGFRISQLMVPFSAWHKIFEKYERLSSATFHNEVLGESFDSASVPITEKDLLRACQPDLKMIESNIHKRIAGRDLFMGVDWGTSEVSKSKTVAVVGYFHTPEQFQIVYVKKFGEREKDPLKQVDEIVRIAGKFQCRLVACDYGFGHVQNKMLENKLGVNRVTVVYYSQNQKKNVNWNKQGRMFVVNKPKLLSNFFTDIKSTKIRFFNWEEFKATTIHQDFLNEYMEYDERNRTLRYDHASEAPDDGLHASFYCKFAGMVYYGVHRRE